MSIKFEVGKEYVTRGGEVVSCTSVTESHNEYPVRVERLDGPGFTVAKNGSFFISGTPDMSDLISEHRAAEPMPTDEAQIKHMVERFLNWKLPENFNPDGGISFERFGNKGTPHEYRREPVGTNLFDAIQAAAMVRHMLEGLGSVPVQTVTDDYSDEVSDAAMKKMATLSSGLEFETTDEHKILRDKFSMAALTGLLARSHVDPEIAAVRAFAYAKFMMEARKK